MTAQKIAFTDDFKMTIAKQEAARALKAAEDHVYHMAAKYGEPYTKDPLALLQDTPSELLRIARDEYKFPAADDKFNLDAMGLDFSDEDDFIKKARHWSKFNFEMDEKDNIVLSDTQPEFEKYIVYSSPEIEKILKVSKQLATVFNKAADAGLMQRPSNHHHPQLLTNFHTITVNESKYVVDNKAIMNQFSRYHA